MDTTVSQKISLDELNKNLDTYIQQIGVNEKLRENPAYNQILNQIHDILMQAPNYLSAEIKDKTILLSTFPPDDVNHYVTSISCGEDSINIFKNKGESKGYNKSEQHTNITAKFHETSGRIAVTEFNTIKDDYNCKPKNGKLTNNYQNFSREMLYDSNGIMMSREYTTYEPVYNSEYGSYVDEKNKNIHKPVEREVLTRDSFDTARYMKFNYKNDKNAKTFSATVPLSQEHGLQNMILPGGQISQTTDDIIIMPMYPQEVEQIISKEKDQKVAEGLRKWAIGRENYFYNSSRDQKYVNTSKVDAMIKAMEQGTMDVNGNPITQTTNYENTRTMGFGGLILISIVTGILSVGIIFAGVLLGLK